MRRIQMAKRALILVDIQNDFVPGGALVVPDGHAVVRKGIDKRIDSYSGLFDNHHRKETERAGRLREARVDTDYCVKFTTLDSRQLGFETWLIAEGARAINVQAGDEQRSIREMIEAVVHMD